MESTLIWLIAAVLIAAVFIPYLVSFRRSQQAARVSLDQARGAGTGRPRGQYPQVDRALCIGCGACVDACPEGDVLAVVWGKAEVLHGDHCVGHGFCETACPVGALKVGLGDIRNRPDIPILSECNETSVPGIFIAGELSGISLIRHAISHGRLVVNEIARRRREHPSLSDRRPGSAEQNIFDLVVVGAGPAGLTAALAAREHGLACLVLDQYDPGGSILHYPRRKLVMTQPVEIPLYGRLDRDEYSKEDLLAIWQQLARNADLNILTGCKVESVDRAPEGFRINTADQRSFHSIYVILALGRRGTPRQLGVPGEDLPKVLYQLVDARSYSNQHILIVGGGDSAIEAAIGLARRSGNVVTLSYRKAEFFRIKRKNEDRVTAMMESGSVRAVFSSDVKEIRPRSVVLTVGDNDLEIPNDTVIVQAGGIPPFEMLKRVGIAFGGDSLSLAETDRRCTHSR